MTTFADRFAEVCRDELVRYKQSLESLKSGAMHTGERTVERPEWRDTTQETIAHYERIVAQLADILARHEA